MTTSLSGVTPWTSTIRTSIIEASCRQVFKDQIQDQGFKYLDDYFSSILGAVSQDPMIDFVKTPGRKIDKHRKMKDATDPHVNDCETAFGNMYPPHSFRQVPLHLKEKKVGLHYPVSLKHLKEEFYHELSEQPAHQNITNIPEASENTLERHFVSSQVSSNAGANSIQDLEHTQNYRTLGLPIPALTTELSIIPEGAEPADVNKSHESQVSDSPTSPADDVAFVLGRPLSIISSTGVDLIPSKPSSDRAREPSRLPLEVIASPSLSAPSFTGMSSLSTSTSQPLMNQSVLPFPSLPAPSPLRKSVRGPRDTSTSLAEVPLGIPAPALGKRTSWLMKAREVKAMESVVAKEIPLGDDAWGANNQTTQATVKVKSKRKSEEAFGMVASDNVDRHQDVSERRLKAVKIHFYETHTSKFDGEKDFFHAGEGSVNTVGDATAAVTLAEARAAAETRVAKRNKLYEDTTITTDPKHPESSTSNNFLAKLPERSKPPISLLHGSQHLYSYNSVRDQTAEVDVADPSKEGNEIQSGDNRYIVGDGFGGKGTWLYSPTRCTVVEHNTVIDKPRSPAVLPSEESEQIVLPMKDGCISSPILATCSLSGQLLHGMPGRIFSPLHPLQADSENYRTPVSAKPDRTLFDIHHATMTPRWQTDDIFLSQTFLSPDQRDSDLGDDCLPVEDRLAGSQEVETPLNFDKKENSMTWSTSPTEIPPGNPGLIRDDICGTWEGNALDGYFGPSKPILHQLNARGSRGNQSNHSNVEGEISLAVLDFQRPDCPTRGAITLDHVEDLESVISHGQQRAQSSTQTSKVVGSTLSGSRKGRHELKSLQLAAVAAKRQQEEQDKKATRLKEMENRRIQAQQRKILEDRARALEEEKKMKEESEKRKREREEQNDKRLLKNATTKKMEQDAIKKRKVDVDIEKKQFKQPLPKDALSSSELGAEPCPKSSRVTAVAVPSSTTKTPLNTGESSQMQAMKESAEPVVSSENIELPDVNSEYSDSEDEDRPRTFDLPEWAHSPELNEALQNQSRLNPDDVFGVIRPLRMEEMFRTRQSRFRARTSSANWLGTDKLTIEEEKEYARRMGFR